MKSPAAPSKIVLCGGIILIVQGVTPLPVFAQPDAPEKALVPSLVTPDKSEEQQKVDALKSAKTLEELALIVDEIEKGPERSPLPVLDALRVVTARFRYYDFDRSPYPYAYRLAQKCAYLVLQRADEMAIRDEMPLLEVLTMKMRDPILPKTDEKRVEIRKRNVTLLFPAWKRINEVAKLPVPLAFMNIPKPYNPGTETPEQRERYAKLLKDNAERTEMANRITTAKWAAKILLSQIESYLAYAYAKPAGSVEELKKLMDEAELPVESKARILTTLDKQIKSGLPYPVQYPF